MKSPILVSGHSIKSTDFLQARVFNEAGGEDLLVAGYDSRMRSILEAVAKVAPTVATVLIGGESGTGKDLIARLVHQCSPRRDGAWVPVNCGAIPASLVESELFGAMRGAFTGADRDTDGLIASAKGGTLFLDEIGELPLDAQVKLLRFLQTGRARAVGAIKDRHVDVRVIAATNRDLQTEDSASISSTGFTSSTWSCLLCANARRTCRRSSPRLSNASDPEGSKGVRFSLEPSAPSPSTTGRETSGNWRTSSSGSCFSREVLRSLQNWFVNRFRNLAWRCIRADRGRTARSDRREAIPSRCRFVRSRMPTSGRCWITTEATRPGLPRTWASTSRRSITGWSGPRRRSQARGATARGLVIPPAGPSVRGD